MRRKKRRIAAEVAIQIANDTFDRLTAADERDMIDVNNARYNTVQENDTVTTTTNNSGGASDETVVDSDYFV